MQSKDKEEATHSSVSKTEKVKQSRPLSQENLLVPNENADLRALLADKVECCGTSFYLRYELD